MELLVSLFELKSNDVAAEIAMKWRRSRRITCLRRREQQSTVSKFVSVNDQQERVAATVNSMFSSIPRASGNQHKEGIPQRKARCRRPLAQRQRKTVAFQITCHH